MKKLLIAFTFGYFLPAILFSQDFWEKVTIPEGDSIVSLLGVNNSGTVFLGTGTYHFYYSDDHGDNWTESDNWPDFYEAKCIDFNSSGTLFVGTFSNGMLRSDDGGATFTPVNNGLSFLNVWDIDIDDNDTIIVATPGGIFRSGNNGDLWESIGSGLPDDIEAVRFGSNNRIYAGTYASGMWRSEDNGETWTETNNGLPDSAMITALEVIPDTEMFAGIFPDGLFRSIDFGDSWHPYNNGLPFGTNQMPGRGISISCIVVIYEIIYLAVYFYGTYFLSRPVAADHPAFDDYLWILQDAGLPANPTTSTMAGGGPESNLFLGTYDQGMYRNAYPVRIEQIAVVKQQYQLGKIMPNPVSNAAFFTFSVPDNTEVSISVYNLSGQIVETVVNEKFNKGTYQVQWTPQVSKGGLYFMKMEADNFDITKKFILLK